MTTVFTQHATNGPSSPSAGTADVYVFPCSFAQQPLWFLDQFRGAGTAYHMPGAVRLQGPLDRSALQATLDAIVARHEVLRTAFVNIDGTPLQVIAPAGSFALQFIDPGAQTQTGSEAEVQRQAAEEAQAPFDLSTGPLIRGRLIRLADDDHILFVTMHHSERLDVLTQKKRELIALLATRDRLGKRLSPIHPFNRALPTPLSLRE